MELLFEPVNKPVCLDELYESNYLKLNRLIPDLTCLQSNTLLSSPSNSLHIKIIEQTPFTLTLELNSNIAENSKALELPALKIRVYLDAKLAEALSDYARPCVNKRFKNFSASLEIMDYKWRLNFFLQKWLDHCLTKHATLAVSA